jgi:hypothetical protein
LSMPESRFNAIVISQKWCNQLKLIVLLYFFLFQFLVRPTTIGPVATLAVMGAQRIHPGISNDAAGAGNALSPFSFSLKLGRQQRDLGRGGGRLVQQRQRRPARKDHPAC